MNTAFLVATSVIIFALGYYFYGGFLRKLFKLRGGDGLTPAHQLKDGVDYVPARLPVIMGHHFASIAGAGPIIGPVLAVKYGWLPAFVWIIVGNIFIGAVHDFTSLVASVRHNGRSIGELIEKYIGETGKLLFSGFTFFALVLVVAVFTDVVAKTFVKKPQVASASLFFLISAVVFGILNYRLRLRGILFVLVSLILVVASVLAGFHTGISFSYGVWVGILLIYIYLAATLPVWLLLQPRDFLNSILLYFLLGGTLIGALFLAEPVHMPVYTSFAPGGIEKLDFLFPFLFVTVACGAVSGFHSLVSSGTTSKQLDKETHALPVGYGMMLIEGVLAVVALASAAVLSGTAYASELKEGGPIIIFSAGAGKFLSVLGFSSESGMALAALAVSAFALTSLDTSTRLARFVVEEVLIENSAAGNFRFVSTLIVVAVSGLLLLSGGAVTLWPLFGSANQLLAGLALLGVYAWLSRTENFSTAFVKYPMYFVLAFTLVSLLITGYRQVLMGNYILAVVAGFLFALAVLLVVKNKIPTGGVKQLVERS